MTGKIAGIIRNDFSAAPGVSLTVFVQGCPIHCPMCHNPETQNFEGGKDYTFEIQDKILNGLTANGIKRNFCIMGGEPCCVQNAEFTLYLIQMIKINYPDIPIYIWSGYTWSQLKSFNDENINEILMTADYLIDGPYIHSKRDITLFMRGSRNQRIIDLKARRDVTDDFT